MKGLRSRIPVGVGVLLGLAVEISALGQSRTVTLMVDDPRPLARAAAEIEKLGSIPVNYEDVRIESPGDMKDVADEVQSPAQRAAHPNAQIIVPRGGQLSANILVDAESGRLPNMTEALAALNSVVAAHNSSNLPGRFRLESYGGAFFIEPTLVRNPLDRTVPVTPLLATPITLAEETRNAYQTLELILDQVSRATGVRVGSGTVPLNGMAMTTVTIGAESEPAKQVISRFLRSVALWGHDDASPVAGMSYALFCGPGSQSCSLNIHPVPSPVPQPGSTPPSTPSPVPSVPSPFYERTP
jgi:hypothetical protein